MMKAIDVVVTMTNTVRTYIISQVVAAGNPAKGLHKRPK